MSKTSPKCFVCDATDQDLPLVRLEFRGTSMAICPKHLPILIHQTEVALALLKEQTAGS